MKYGNLEPAPDQLKFEQGRYVWADCFPGTPYLPWLPLGEPGELRFFPAPAEEDKQIACFTGGVKEGPCGTGTYVHEMEMPIEPDKDTSYSALAVKFDIATLEPVSGHVLLTPLEYLSPEMQRAEKDFRQLGGLVLGAELEDLVARDTPHSLPVNENLKHSIALEAARSLQVEFPANELAQIVADINPLNSLADVELALIDKISHAEARLTRLKEIMQTHSIIDEEQNRLDELYARLRHLNMQGTENLQAIEGLAIMSAQAARVCENHPGYEEAAVFLWCQAGQAFLKAAAAINNMPDAERLIYDTRNPDNDPSSPKEWSGLSFAYGARLARRINKTQEASGMSQAAQDLLSTDRWGYYQAFMDRPRIPFTAQTG